MWFENQTLHAQQAQLTKSVASANLCGGFPTSLTLYVSRKRCVNIWLDEGTSVFINPQDTSARVVRVF